MLDTFFFGYLELKWRRLVRTFFLISTILFQLFMLLIFIESNFDFDPHLIEFLMTFLIYPFIGLISWVLKPFIVKD